MLIRKFTLPLGIATVLLASPLAFGQAVSTTTTTSTNTAGLVSEIAPDGLIIRTEGSTVPIRYSSSASTIYVDETGNPVARELVTSGLPVTVYYSRDGERMIADRVVVRRQTTTTTSPAPTVIERNTTVTRPPVVVEKPVIVEKKVLVDRPVVVEKKVPVVVEKPVYIEKRVPVPAPAPVIEERKTTTTTTTTKGKKDD